MRKEVGKSVDHDPPLCPILFPFSHTSSLFILTLLTLITLLTPLTLLTLLTRTYSHILTNPMIFGLQMVVLLFKGRGDEDNRVLLCPINLSRGLSIVSFDCIVSFLGLGGL